MTQCDFIVWLERKGPFKLRALVLQPHGGQSRCGSLHGPTLVTTGFPFSATHVEGLHFLAAAQRQHNTAQCFS